MSNFENEVLKVEDEATRRALLELKEEVDNMWMEVEEAMDIAEEAYSKAEEIEYELRNKSFMGP